MPWLVSIQVQANQAYTELRTTQLCQLKSAIFQSNGLCVWSKTWLGDMLIKREIMRKRKHKHEPHHLLQPTTQVLIFSADKCNYAQASTCIYIWRPSRFLIVYIHLGAAWCNFDTCKNYQAAQDMPSSSCLGSSLTPHTMRGINIYSYFAAMYAVLNAWQMEEWCSKCLFSSAYPMYGFQQLCLQTQWICLVVATYFDYSLGNKQNQ